MTRVILPPTSEARVIYQLLGWLEGKIDNDADSCDAYGLKRAKAKLDELIETYSAKENEMAFLNLQGEGLVAEYAVEIATKKDVDFKHFPSILANVPASICACIADGEKKPEHYEKMKEHYLEIFDDCYSNAVRQYA